jgi:hypothetical protein
MEVQARSLSALRWERTKIHPRKAVKKSPAAWNHLVQRNPRISGDSP